MRKEKKVRLQKAGWTVGTVDEFLELDQAEAHLVELKLRMADWLRARRRDRRTSQITWAKRIGSSQSRVAKIEAADPGVTLDLMFRSAFASGATSREIARVVAASGQKVSRKSLSPKASLGPRTKS